MRGIAIRLAIIGAIALGAFVFRDRLSGNAGELAVGDCFQVPAEETVEDVQHTPCNEGHTGEVIFVGDYPGADDDAPYPSDIAWDNQVGASCVPAFNSYTGLDYETDQTFGVGYFTPTQEGWDDGDHELICYATRIDEAPMTNSLKAGGG